MRRPRGAWLLVPLLLAACGEEEPLDVGRELLPAQALRSFELVLEPEQYLLQDTAFTYGEVDQAGFMLLARDFEGVLNARGWARFDLPTAIGIKDSAGVSRTDSAATFFRGEVVLYVDTLADYDSTWSFRVALHAVAEPWDAAVADWDNRQTGVAWSTPGGTPGALISTAPVRPDSIVLPVDSATLLAWRDTTNTRRGVLLSLLDAPARIRTARPVLKVYARSAWHPDTTFMVVSQAPAARFDYRPRPALVAGEARISGLPNWRSFLHFRPDLRAAVVSCGVGCTIPLRSTSITRAELVLQPARPPAGFLPELPLQPAAYQVLASAAFPLQRSPLGTFVGSVDSTVAAARFAGGGAPLY
ncbi:MAG: hypothetical protein FIB01_13365, partial [Gemmatimonadetes bacterium]|nr:hypothetical protein [Gemmatimonadota bacterium]